MPCCGVRDHFLKENHVPTLLKKKVKRQRRPWSVFHRDWNTKYNQFEGFHILRSLNRERLNVRHFTSLFCSFSFTFLHNRSHENYWPFTRHSERQLRVLASLISECIIREFVSTDVLSLAMSQVYIDETGVRAKAINLTLECRLFEIDRVSGVIGQHKDANLRRKNGL